MIKIFRMDQLSRAQARFFVVFRNNALKLWIIKGINSNFFDVIIQSKYIC